MKKLYFLSVPAAAIFTLTSCGNFSGPINSSGSSPLDPPGMGSQQDETNTLSNIYRPGALLVTASPRTPFFDRFPKDQDQPSKILANNIDVRIISTRADFANIEILNTGETGFVPTVLLTEATAIAPVAPATGDSPEIDIPGADTVPPADFVPPLPPSS